MPITHAIVPLLTSGGLLLAASAASAQTEPALGSYFGFDPTRIVVVDDGAGPAIAADIDGDGRTDLVVANDAKSRIEVHLQRADRRTDAELERELKTNELPPSRWFDREEISVANRIAAMCAVDLDEDGLLDLLYAGIQPSEVVVLRQTSPLRFELVGRQRERDLGAGPSGFAVANVLGDERNELLTIIDGRIAIFELGPEGPVGEPRRAGSDGDVVAFFVEDYDGNGRDDVLGVVPDDKAPLRLWLQESRGREGGALGPELRFEMPPIVEVEPVRFPGRAAAAISVIERQSRRIVLYDLGREGIDAPAGVEAAAAVEISPLEGGEAGRSVDIGDVDGDGLADLVATNRAANGIVLHRQRTRQGLGDGRFFSAFKEPQTVALGQWGDDSGPLEIFVLSAEEKAVGVSRYDARNERIGFPQPLTLATTGAEPVAVAPFRIDGRPGAAVVVKERRDHALELHHPDMEPRIVELEDVSRSPESLLAIDLDQDGVQDLAMLTPREPMVVYTGADGRVWTEDNTPQFGLVQAAGPQNTAALDVDGDGEPELLIADQNFVRACRFEGEAGWRVVDQITMSDASTKLEALTTIELDGTPTIVASDTANDRLVLMAADADGTWGVTGRLRLDGIEVTGIRGGAFSGDSEPNVLALTGGGFGLVRLGGERPALEQFAAYRSDSEDRFEHEIEVGDVNGDGYVDLVVLEARENICQIFTFSAARNLLFATEFKVFESRLFDGGGGAIEPSAALLADLTGDGRTDLVLEVHDRYLLYPQAGMAEGEDR